MRTILLLTIVFAALVFPLHAARAADPRRGIRRLLVLLLVFNAFYLVYATRFHPDWFLPHRP